MGAPENKVDILVVDDLPDKLLAFQAVLDELGENLVLVSSGADALRELLKREFAVILLDVNMPDIDGIETAELIRQHNKTAHTPIIFVTAYADEMQTARGYELGAVDYILSPIVPQILRSKVRVFVELFRAQRRAKELARAEADREAAEEATRRSEFISRASRELTASLDLDASMQSFLGFVVPSFAEFALVSVKGGDGQQFVVCSDQSARDAFVSSLGALPIRLRRAITQAQIDGHRVDVRLNGDRPRDWPKDVVFVRVLPMLAGQRTIGVVILGSASGRAQNQGDSTLLELVSCAAIAFDNAQLFGNLKREMLRSKQAQQKLKDADRRKDEFLAMLSHELRNPLAPIRAAAEVMRRVAPSDPRIAWAGGVVDRQVGHLAQLVDDLLDVSRVTQGKITLQSDRVELTKAVLQSVESMRPNADTKRHKLTLNLPPNPIWIHGDFARLAQVFGNLLNNAVKYTPEGGKLEVAVGADNGKAFVSVRDNGIGIDGELLPHVFEPFTQGARTLDRTQGGLGVGLTVVERLVALHHGEIEVKSEGLGKGAEFRVTLPCVSEVRDVDDRAARPEHLIKRTPGKRVLVVDDNADAAETIAVFLRLEGHDVQTANDGFQAITCVQSFTPEVAVVDIGLPGMDGYELARRLAEGRSKPLLIALTGYGQSDDRARSRAAGFEHHFIKPADPHELHAAIVGDAEGGDVAEQSEAS